MFKNFKNEDYVYVYEDHRDSSLFVSKEKLTYDEKYCDNCRSEDYLIDEGFVKELKNKYEPIMVLNRRK